MASLPRGHIQALNGYLHRIYICLYSTDHFHWIIFIVKLYYYCPADGYPYIHDLFPSPYFFTSQYHQPRRCFIPGMNHRTKGDCMPRDSINDHPIACGESSSDFMFQLVTSSRLSQQRRFKSPAQFSDRTFQEANVIFSYSQ